MTAKPKIGRPRKKRPQVRHFDSEALARFAPKGAPEVGDWVASTANAARGPRVGRVAVVFAAKEAWQRAIRAPTLIVQWRPGAKLRVGRDALSRGKNATYRSMWALRPATVEEARTAVLTWAALEAALEAETP